MLINELDGRVEMVTSEAERMFNADHPAWQDMGSLKRTVGVYLSFEDFDRHKGHEAMKKLDSKEIQIYTDYEKVLKPRQARKTGRIKRAAMLALGTVMTFSLVSRQQDKISELQKENDFLQRWNNSRNQIKIFQTPYFPQENELPSDTLKLVI